MMNICLLEYPLAMRITLSFPFVLYRNKEATVVFGPYEKNYKKLYEIQTQDGKIITATSSALHKIKK